MAEINLNNVWKIYNQGQKNALEAVRDVSLQVKDGELMAFLGPSGCGKTSILRMIAGLEEISKGTISFDGQTVNNRTPAERNIAMAFETYALYPHMTVRENLSFCLRARNLKSADIEERVDKIASAIHLQELLDRRPSELPGGQQQLVSVARAMIRNPEVFLLDEPFSHIDASLKTNVRQEIKRLVNTTRTTTILVTHDQHEALAMADRIMVMNYAEIQQVGTAADLIYQPANVFTANFVGEPSINFIHCRFEKTASGGRLTALDAVGSFPVSADTAARLEKADTEEVLIGIRPQEIRLTSVENSFFQGEVSLFEFLGEEGHLMVDSGQTKITVVTEPFFSIEVGSTVGLGVDPSRIFIFDRKTEKALSHGV